MPKYKGEQDYRHGTPDRLGVLLVNLGTPDAPTTAAVRRYLAEFLWDPRVIEVPRPLWWLILHGVILRIRPKRSAEAYAKVWTDDDIEIFIDPQGNGSRYYPYAVNPAGALYEAESDVGAMLVLRQTTKKGSRDRMSFIFVCVIDVGSRGCQC